MNESAAVQKADRVVVVIQRVMPFYRIAFFSRLSQRLKQHGVQLKVLYGQESPGSVPKTVHPDKDWAEFVENKYMSLGRTELVWQKCMFLLTASDLVIVEQANRLLVNYLLLVRRAFGSLRLAYWGHGCNLQVAGTATFSEWLKARVTKSVDWWFAYTQLSAGIVSAAGFPQERITAVENSIDTEEFEQAVNSVTPEQIRELRDELGIGHGPVALYCGAMYLEKQLPFLLDAAKKLRARIEDFNFVLVGTGPDKDLVKNEAERHTWMHYVGAVYGPQRAAYFCMCDILLMPGAVGLVIVDSFVAGVPMITTDIPSHGPEIAYLDNGKNGIITPFRIDDYVTAIAECFSKEGRLEVLHKGCKKSAARYTLNAMAENFEAGILSCLSGR